MAHALLPRPTCEIPGEQLLAAMGVQPRLDGSEVSAFVEYSTVRQ